jgi:hypothetical protein
MDYGAVIRQAWSITWRYRFLWLLGILAGGAVGVPSTASGGRGGSGSGATDFQNLDPSLVRIGQQLQSRALDNVGLLLAAAGLFVGLGLVLLVLSFVAQGAMAEATAEIASGRPSTLSGAWSAGLHLFWRYVLLCVIVAVAAVLLAGVFGGLIVSAMRGPAVAAGLGVLAMLFLVLAGLVLSIVVAFAQRAIAVEDVGPIAALRDGWLLTRQHLGGSLLTWLVNLGLAVGAGVVMLVGFICALVVLGGIGAALFAVTGLSTPVLVYVGVGTLLLVAAGLIVLGIGNTFFWSYWTLAYLRLSGRQSPAVPV